jgi:hypothetical protein
MSKRVKAGRTGSRAADISGRALRELEEVERRRYHERIRADLVQRGAIAETVEKLLEEAAPRFRDKGWKVTETKEENRWES